VNRSWPGHLSLTLRPGLELDHVPAHLDLLAGAARYANVFRVAPVDRVLSKWACGARITAQYHAKASMGRFGFHARKYDDFEESLGMSRTYKVQIGETDRVHDVVDALRALAEVGSAEAQQLATIPFEALPTTRPPASRESALRAATEPHRRVHAPEAHALEQGDERVITAVVDTGVVVGHPEFQRKCLAGYDTVDLGIGQLNSDVKLLGDSRGWDYNPNDEVGHGCQCAGIIAAHGWEIPVGVGGKTMILPLRVLCAAVKPGGTRRMGVGALCDINAGMKIAVDLGAHVINMSFGTPAASVDEKATVPHARVIRYATHYGCVLVAAAGNSGLEEKFYPAAHPEVIAVASVDEAGRRSRFSTFGDHVAISAPGENIVSASLRGYQMSNGTSFAAPFVAGAAALLLARARAAGVHLDPPRVRDLLVRSATRLGVEGVCKETGHGLLNVAAALRLFDAERRKAS
jgi:subtilisin family serine protease